MEINIGNVKKMREYELIFVLIFLILTLNINLILSDSTDIDYKKIGINADVQATGTEMTKTSEGFVFKLSLKNPSLTINENKFENIQSSPDSVIVLDARGKILRAKFTTNENGGTYNIDGEGTQIKAPPNSLVEFNRGKDGKNTASMKPEKGSDITPPVVKNKNIIVNFEGGEMKLNGNSISGKLSYDKDGAFVDSSGTLNINNVRVGNSEPVGFGEVGKEIRLFFDGKMHDGNSVSFGAIDLYINSVDSKMSVEFLENNPYARIDKNDAFAFDVGKESQIEIRNRDELGLIPVALAKGENIAVIEDAKSLFARGENIDIEKLGNLYISSTTSPIELAMTKSDGSDFLGVFAGGEKISGNKIIVDNFNRIALIPKDSQEGLAVSENINTLFSAKVSYNYPTKDELESLTEKKITMDKISEGSIDEALGKLRDYWGTLSDETKSGVGNINFVNPQASLPGPYATVSVTGLKPSVPTPLSWENAAVTPNSSAKLRTLNW